MYRYNERVAGYSETMVMSERGGQGMVLWVILP